MAADEWIWPIGNASEWSSTPRILKAQFGMGHAQTIKEGGDNDNLTLNLNVAISVMTVAEAKAAKNFLEGKGGAQSFTWTPVAPYDDVGQAYWRCESWKFSYQGGDIVSFAGLFEQVVMP